MFKNNYRLHNIYCIEGEGEYLKIPRSHIYNNCVILKMKNSELLCLYCTKLSNDYL